MTTCRALLTILALGTFSTSGLAQQVEERDEIFVSGGKRIHVEVFAPAGRERHPAVLVLHSAAGMLAGKQDLERFSRQLAAQGFVAFFIHYFDRTRTLIAGEKAIHELSATWTETVKDGADFAAAHSRVRSSSMGIFGYSLGAFLAVAESSLDPRIGAVAEVAGGIFEGFAPRMKRMPPILILHGRADQRVPVKQAFALQEAAHRLGSKSELKIYEGEGHRLSPPASQDATERALVFFQRHL